MRIAALIGLVAIAGVGGWFAPDVIGGATAASTAVSAEQQRAEIERILGEDIAASNGGGNQARLAGMQAIQQGQAPDDFWEAYQVHIASAARVGRETGVGGKIVQVAAEKRFWGSYEALVAVAKKYGADTSEPDRLIAERD